MLRQQSFRVRADQGETKCLSSYESDAKPKFLIRFIAECRTFFENLYVEEKCQDRKILMGVDATQVRCILQLMVTKWCSTTEKSHQYLNNLEKVLEQNSQCIHRIIDKIMQVSQSEIVIVGVTYLVGYQYVNKHSYIVPVFRVYRNEWDKKPIFVDTNAQDYNNLANCLKSINLPESLICLPVDGVFQYDHRSNILLLECYIKRSNDTGFSFLPFSLYIESIFINLKLLADFPYKAFENSKFVFSNILKSNSCTEICIHVAKASQVAFFNLVNRIIKVENLLIICKNAFSVLCEFMNSYFVREDLLCDFANSLLHKGNILISSNNFIIAYIFIDIIVKCLLELENNPEVHRENCKTEEESNINSNNSENLFSVQLGMTILSVVVKHFMPNIIKFLSFMTNDQPDIERLKDLSQKIVKALDIFCTCLDLSPTTSVSKLCRTLQCMFKNFLTRKIRRQYPSEEMEKIIDLTGEDYSLSNFLRMTGLIEGKLNEEGKTCLEVTEVTENEGESVLLLYGHNKKNLFLVYAPLIQASEIVRKTFKIPSDVPFEKKGNDFGKFYKVNTRETFILYNYIDDKFNCTFICRKFETSAK